MMLKNAFDAVESDNLEELKIMIKRDPSLFDQRNSRGKTLLIHAACRGRYECLKFILLNTNRPFEHDLKGKNVLHYVVESSPMSCELAYESFAWIVDYQDKKGFPLNLEKVDGKGRTFLHIAGACGNEKLFHYLLDKLPALKNARDHQGMAPLHLLVLKNQLELLEAYRLKMRLDFNLLTNDKRTVAHLAAENGHKKALKFIVSSDLSFLTAKDKRGFTPLLTAAEAGQVQIVKQLHAWGAPLDDCDKYKRTASHLVAMAPYIDQNKHQEQCLQGYLDLQSFLLMKAPNQLSQRDKHHLTPLLCAAQAGRLKLIQNFLRGHPHLIDGIDASGRNACHLAAASGHIQTVKWLCDEFAELKLPLRKPRKDRNILFMVLEANGIPEENRYRLVCYLAKHYPELNFHARRYHLFKMTPYGVAKKLSKQNLMLGEIAKVLKMEPRDIPADLLQLDARLKNLIETMANLDRYMDIAQIDKSEFSIEQHIFSKIPKDLYGEYYQGVWKEQDEHDQVVHTPVLIKRLDLAYLPNQLPKIRNEFRVLSKLRHDNILQLHGYHLSPQGRVGYLMTEEAQLGSLMHVLADRSTTNLSLPADLRITWAKQICDALVFTHKKRILHRNLTSNSIVLNENSRAKVTNFSLAKIDSYTRFSTVFNRDTQLCDADSIAYWAPEILPQLDARPVKYTAQADVYSFGMICFAILTRSEPLRHFDGNRNSIKRHIESGKREQLPDIGSLPASDPARQLLSCGFGRLITRCWAPNLFERPTFEMLSEQLKSMLNELPRSNELKSAKAKGSAYTDASVDGDYDNEDCSSEEEDGDEHEQVLSSDSVEQGLICKKMSDDSACLFSAVAIHCGKTSRDLRTSVAKYFTDNSEHYNSFICTQYIDSISEGADDIDYIQIVGIQRVTGRPIIVIYADKKPTIPDNLSEFNGDPIFVYYRGAGHYDRFIIKKHYDSKEILKKINSDIASNEWVVYPRVPMINGFPKKRWEECAAHVSQKLSQSGVSSHGVFAGYRDEMTYMQPDSSSKSPADAWSDGYAQVGGFSGPNQ